ncbi:MAG: TonB-dependent receptor [Rubrivivax sp.]
MKRHFPLHELTSVAALMAASFTPAAAHAQQASAPVQQVLITGNPLGSDTIATPTSVLTGQDLVLRRGSTLGETLDTLPGVSATYFGPNASRPTIRGQDGDRVRILSNAGASFDASALSFDHAVPIDPLVIERLEVLRGPAALLYGGSAVGGAVNAIDNRIPKAALGGAASISGAVEARLGGAADERALSGLVEAGATAGSGVVIHADAFRRHTSDLRAPDFDRPTENGGSERRRRIVNSASQADGGAVGASTVWEHGYLGASIDTYRNDYGTVAEEDVTIRLRRNRVALAGEWRLPDGFITAVRGQASGTDYQHKEIGGDGAVGTTFANRGADFRLEAVHRPLPLGAVGQLEGTVGVQGERSRFSALGEEAFVPTTHTTQSALFWLERWSFGKNGHIGAGVRGEQVKVTSDGDGDAETPRFGAASGRSFGPRSGSVDGVYDLSPVWRLASSFSYTERAPTSPELYANGLHAATATYERGDPQQQLERGRNIDASIAWHNGPNHFKVGAYDSRFSNYILLSATGEPEIVDGESSYPVFAFRGVPARLYGFEAEGSWRVLSGPRNVDLDARFDSVTGTDRSSGQPLPRLSPRRITLGVKLQQQAFTARVELQRAQAQNRVPATDVPTAGSTLVNLSAGYQFSLGREDALLFAKLQNIGNTLAFSSSTTETLRPLAPLPGRALSVGLRVTF